MQNSDERACFKRGRHTFRTSHMNDRLSEHSDLSESIHMFDSSTHNLQYVRTQDRALANSRDSVFP